MFGQHTSTKCNHLYFVEMHAYLNEPNKLKLYYFIFRNYSNCIIHCIIRITYPFEHQLVQYEQK